MWTALIFLVFLMALALGFGLVVLEIIAIAAVAHVVAAIVVILFSEIFGKKIVITRNTYKKDRLYDVVPRDFKNRVEVSSVKTSRISMFRKSHINHESELANYGYFESNIRPLRKVVLKLEDYYV